MGPGCPGIDAASSHGKMSNSPVSRALGFLPWLPLALVLATFAGPGSVRVAAQTTLDAEDASRASSAEGEGRGAQFGARPGETQLARLQPAGVLTTTPGDDAYGAALPGIRPVEDVNGDGSSNPCGPYASAVAARSFAGGGLASFRDAYDRMAPSHFGFGTGPQAMERYLMAQGLTPRSQNSFSVDGLADRIDRGERGLILVNLAADDPDATLGRRFENLHWMAVKGYNVLPDENGNPVRHFLFEDTALARSGAFAPGGRYPAGIPEDELQRIWSSPVPRGFGTLAGNVDRYYMGVSEQSPTWMTRLRQGAYLNGDQTRLRVAMDGAYDATRGFDRTFAPIGSSTPGDRLGGFTQMVAGGGLKGGLNLVPAGVSTAGNFIEQGGDALLGWGADRWNRGGLVNRSLGVGSTILGSVPKAGGWAVGGVGNLGSSAVGVAADTIEGVGNFAGRRIDDVGRGARRAWNWASSWF